MKARLTAESASTFFSSRWHPRQRLVCSRFILSLSAPAATGRAWQVRQEGASVRPATSAEPWADSRYIPTAFAWHSEQEAASLAPANADLGPLAGSIPWPPWHATQSVSCVARAGGAANSEWNAWVFATASWHPLQSTGATGPWWGRAFGSTPSWQSVQPRAAWTEPAITRASAKRDWLRPPRHK